MITDSLKDRIGDFTGQIGICYIDLKSGESLNAGNCDLFPASGMVRIPALVETFRQIKTGKISPEQSYTIRKSDYLNTSERSFGIMQFLHPGLSLTIEDLYRIMIIGSDNMAFNIILNLIGQREVNKCMQELGFSKTRINRCIYDMKKIHDGVENYVSIEEMALLLYRMYRGQVVSNEASEEMLELLSYHQRTDIIPFYFSENMKISHICASDDNLLLDMGVVYGENPYVLCMAACTYETPNAESIMRDITLMCHQNSNPNVL